MTPYMSFPNYFAASEVSYDTWDPILAIKVAQFFPTVAQRVSTTLFT